MAFPRFLALSTVHPRQTEKIVTAIRKPRSENCSHRRAIPSSYPQRHDWRQGQPNGRESMVRATQQDAHQIALADLSAATYYRLEAEILAGRFEK